MRQTSFDASPINQATAQSANLTLPARGYFDTLHKLIVGAEVTTDKGLKMNLEDGLGSAIQMIVEMSPGNKVLLIGNGGSAAIASHEALDFWNAAGIPAMAFNDAAQLTCLSNDFGYEHVFGKAIDAFAHPGDTLIAISSSGKSASILNGVAAARAKKCAVLTFAGFGADNPLRLLGDLNFFVDSPAYGHIEVAHLALIHYVTDAIKQMRGKLK